MYVLSWALEANVYIHIYFEAYLDYLLYLPVYCAVVQICP